MHYEIITTVSLITILAIQRYDNIVDYNHYAVHLIPVTYLLYSWTFVPLNSLHLSCLSPYTFPSGTTSYEQDFSPALPEMAKARSNVSGEC